MSEADEICSNCRTVDFYSLFTGPRYFPGDGVDQRVRVKLGTLVEMKANTRCPACRLVVHDLYAGGELAHPWEHYGDEVDPSQVQVVAVPIRGDYYEDMKYSDANRKNMLATDLQIRLDGITGCPPDLVKRIRRHDRGPGIRLLSPDSVVPERPLLNGFRTTNRENSLRLVRQWMETCRESHQDTCHFRDELGAYLPATRLDKIRLIDVTERNLVERNFTEVPYAALSYVWKEAHSNSESFRADLGGKLDGSKDRTVRLPENMPRAIEDATLACQALSIPYLWVDLYCIDQYNEDRKASEINAMGHIYRWSEITLVAGSLTGSHKPSDGKQWGLGLTEWNEDLDQGQRTETIDGRRYITSLPSIMTQIQRSPWNRRSWTMQEGNLATRVAFFGAHDVSFMCGAGHWRESQHSGKYGHDANIPELDLHSQGFYLLSGYNWLSGSEWRFDDYNSILAKYTGRDISLQSDKLNAIVGCLQIIAQKHDMKFLSGLPSKDFHYALLWSREYDKPREGFPSWSWAGWHSPQQVIDIYPKKGDSGCMMELEDGSYEHRGPQVTELELEGFYISPIEHPHMFNRCSQELAQIHVAASTDCLTITSESVHSFIDIVADRTKSHEDDHVGQYPFVRCSFDSTIDSGESWEPETEYITPYDRIRLRDSSGNSYASHIPRWDSTDTVNLPHTIRGSTLTWLLRDGIELIKIVGVKLLEGADGLQKLDHICCLGIARSQRIPGRVTRMGKFWIPREWWEKAGPKETTVEMW